MKYNEKLLRKMIIGNTVAFCVVNFLEAITLLLDEVMVARGIGVNAMVAMGLASPLFAMLALVASVLSVGAQSLCTYAMGAGDIKKNNSIFSSVIVMAFITAILGTIGGVIFLDYMCIFFGASKDEPEVYYMLYNYLKWLLLSIPGYGGYLILSPLVIIDGNKRYISIAAIVQGIVNLIGDYISVYIFNWGIEGVGFFTGISWIVALIILCLNFGKKSAFHFDIKLFDITCFKEIMWIGSPKLTKYICKIIYRVFMNHIIIYFGGMFALSIFSINNSLIGFFYMIGCGLADTIVICTQLLYAEKELDELYRTVKITLQIILIVTGALMVAVLIMSKAIVSLFVVNDEAMIAGANYSIICLAISIPLNALNSVIVGYMQGAKKIKIANSLSFAHRFLSNVLMSIILGYFYGVRGLFAAIPLSELLTLTLYLILAFCVKAGTSLVDRLLLIPADFYDDIKERIEYSITSEKEAINISENVSSFFEKEKYNNKRNIYMVSLCIEEMAGNIAKYGFVRNHGYNICNIKVILHKDDSITIRLRDVCPKFDLKEKYKLMMQGDRFANIGIKLVFGIAKEVEYNNLLGYNTTIIKL